jgi:hypothetical protein
MLRSLRIALALACALFLVPASAAFHLWTMNELYSNADGSVQFLEVTALTGGQEFVGGHTLKSTIGGTTQTFNVPHDLPGDTGGKRMLIATQGFANLGIVTPDFIVPNGFFSPTGGSLNWGEGSDVWTYGALPAPNLSLNRDGTTSINSPRNFAGATGTIPAGSTQGPQSTFNVAGMWWKSPALSESGWGINLVQQGTILFATWFTYDNDGSDLWLFMDNLQLTGTNVFAGNVYRASGSPWGVFPYDPTRFAATQVGNVTFTFTDANTGSVTWTVNGVTQTKSIMRFTYQALVPTCATNSMQTDNINYQDLWWRSPARSENGAGLNILHQGDILFVTWFTYDTDGSQMWLFMDNAAKTGAGVYAGAVKQARGSPINQVPFDPTRFSATEVGSATITFTDANNGNINYTVKGVTEVKPITRFVFSSPVTTCTFPPSMPVMYPGYPG